MLSLATPQAPVTYGKNVALERRRTAACRRCGSTSGSPGLLGAGPPDLARPGRLGERLGQAARPDRLPARQRRGPQRDRARLGRSARPLPRHARRVDAARLCDGRSCRAGASRSSASTAPAGRRSRARRSTRAEIPGAREPDPGPVPSAARSRPWLRPRREPDADRGAGMKRLLLTAFVLALAVPAQASAGRFAIGIKTGADARVVAREVAGRDRGAGDEDRTVRAVRARETRGRAALRQGRVLGGAHAAHAAARVHAQRPA